MNNVCDALSLVRPRVACDRTPGHEGAHMHFGANGTTAWGAAQAVPGGVVLR